jgi:serine/threonine-protein kinase HipA
LRELEHASFELERKDCESDPHYNEWLKLLTAPGSSLGGARPKASVVDEMNHLWIAKFPSRQDTLDIGAWEMLVHELAQRASVNVAPAQAKALSNSNHEFRTFLAKRFDRTMDGKRIHFSSAMNLLSRDDGDDFSKGANYLELVDLIARIGAAPEEDLEQLWRRIAFFVCVSNTDDHLRNHGFLLQLDGWRLSPAYDVNPVASGDGLTLNISETDNALDLDLVRSVAGFFRLKLTRADEIINQVVQATKTWRSIAEKLGIKRSEQELMSRAFNVADEF